MNLKSQNHTKANPVNVSLTYWVRLYEEWVTLQLSSGYNLLVLNFDWTTSKIYLLDMDLSAG